MQKERTLDPSEALHNTMIVDAATNTQATTFLDDEPIASGTYLIAPHLEGVPHAYVVTIPTYVTTTYGLTLLAS